MLRSFAEIRPSLVCNGAHKVVTSPFTKSPHRNIQLASAIRRGLRRGSKETSPRDGVSSRFQNSRNGRDHRSEHGSPRSSYGSKGDSFSGGRASKEVGREGTMKSGRIQSPPNQRKSSYQEYTSRSDSRSANETSNSSAGAVKYSPFREQFANNEESRSAPRHHGGQEQSLYKPRTEKAWKSDRQPYPRSQSSDYGGSQPRYRSNENGYEGHDSRREGSSYRRSERDEKPPRPIKPPPTIPYTTPASEFLYGTSVVNSALRAEGRKLYNLYIYQPDNKEARIEDGALYKHALARGVRTRIVSTPDWLSSMDRMSHGRPHNGYLLEASPLPKRPLTSLGPVDVNNGNFQLELDQQSQEELTVNGADTTIQYTAQRRRYPLVLMLDGILDPGNLGAIMRSAFFLGADAVIVSTHSAPMSAVTLKASAGAIEHLPILSIRQTGSLITNSQQNGWKFYAAVAPPTSLKDSSAMTLAANKHFSTSTLNGPLLDHPCVLMLGGEGTGLRKDLQRKADYSVSIDGNRSGMGGVDSLNVSVAAALLCESFLKHPMSAKVPDEALF